MIIVLKQGTTQQEIDTVTNAVVARGVSVSPIVGTEMTILGLTGAALTPTSWNPSTASSAS